MRVGMWAPCFTSMSFTPARVSPSIRCGADQCRQRFGAVSRQRAERMASPPAITASRMSPRTMASALRLTNH
jgi:hypothetical protein